MHYQTIFYSLFLLLPLASFLLYFLYGKRINQFKDFIAINRSIGTAPLAIAMITYTISGSMIWFEISNTALNGISLSITRAIYHSVIALFFAYYVFPRLLTFSNTYTLGSVIKHMYGQLAGTITSLISSIICCYFIYYQLNSLSVATPFFAQNRSFFLILTGFITIIQALWISNHRISTTSIVQFILIVGLLCALVPIVFYLPKIKVAGQGLQGLLKTLKHEAKVPYDQLVSYRLPWGAFLNACRFPVTFLYPPLIQRVLINQDSPQMQNASWSFAIFHTLFRCLIIIIGLGTILMVMPERGMTVSQFNSTLLSLFQNKWIGLLYSYLVLVSSIGFMSYFLHSLSVELVQNVIKPYRRKPLPYDNHWIKWSIVVVGIFCILCGLIGKQSYYSFFHPLLIFMPAIFAPFIIGCIGLKGNNWTFIIGVVAFYMIALGLLVANRYGYFPIKEGLSFYRRLARTIPLAILGSGLIILLIHYLTYYDFVQREVKKNHGLLNLKRKNRGDSFWKMLSNPLMWAKEKFEEYENNPTAICTFLLFNIAIPNLSGDVYQPNFNLWNLLTIKMIGISLATIMMFHNFFPYRIKKIFPLLWFFTLSYCIPFYYGFAILCSTHNTLLLAKLLGLLLLMRILTDFRTFTALTFIGFGAAYIAYLYLVPAHVIVLSFEEKWFIFELITLLIVISITFITRQEQVMRKRMEINKSLASGFSHDLRNLFQYTNWMIGHELNSESVIEVLENKPDTLKKGTKDLNDLVGVVKCIKSYLEESYRQSEVFHDLVSNDRINPTDIKEIEISKFIERTLSFVPSTFRKKIKIATRKDARVVSHQVILTSTLLNMIKNAFKHGKAEKIIIGWDDKNNNLYVQDNGGGIPADKQPYIFDLYYTTGGSGIGLPFIKNMVERINGSITFQTSPQGTTFYIHLPVEEAVD